MLKDQGAGGTTMLPGHMTQSDGYPRQYINSAIHEHNSERHYQHPSPLSEGHTNPFTSSPVSASQYSGDDSNLTEESHDDPRTMSSSVKKTVKPAQGNSDFKDHSSTWVSTEERS